MDFFQHPRYVINKQLLRVIGLWPYQEKNEKLFCFYLWIFLSSTVWIVQLRKLMIDGTEIIIEAVAPFIVHAGSAIKTVTFLANTDKLIALLQRVQNDWNKPMGSEKKILARFADDGRTFSIIYAVWIYLCTTCFLILPFAPKIVVALGWANFSTTTQFCIPVDYFVNSEDYVVYIHMHLTIVIVFIITVYVSVDAMFVILVQHACGLFSAIGIRLENLIRSEDLHINLYPTFYADKAYWIVVDCIKEHKAAIEFSLLLDNLYSKAFLLMMIVNVPAMSFSGFQMIDNMGKPDQKSEVFRQGMLTAAEMFHLFFEFYFSQRLTDHSLQIFESLYRTKWYMTSMRTRKLLKFLMMRSMIPSELKVGKMYTLSMQNYSSVVRLSMSYLTVLLSM